MNKFTHSGLLVRRPASTQDELWLWTLYHELLKPSVSEQWGWDEQFQKANFHSHLPTTLFTIVENNGDPVAAYALRDHDTHIYLHMLLVTASQQSQSIGTWILDTLKEQVRKAGTSLELSTFPANNVDGYYLKNGFKLVETREDKTLYRWLPDDHQASETTNN